MYIPQQNGENKPYKIQNSNPVLHQPPPEQTPPKKPDNSQVKEGFSLPYSFNPYFIAILILLAIVIAVVIYLLLKKFNMLKNFGKNESPSSPSPSSPSVESPAAAGFRFY